MSASSTRKFGHVARQLPGFWTWFFRGHNGRSGMRRLLDRWALLHVFVGYGLSALILLPIQEVSEKALLPLMAIFVGLSFSWAGNAHALLQSDEIVRHASKRPGGIFEFVYTFQLCILVMLVVITAWVIASLDLPYRFTSILSGEHFNVGAKIFLYTSLSLAIRTSWEAVLGANMLLLIRAEVKRLSEASNTKNDSKPPNNRTPS